MEIPQLKGATVIVAEAGGHLTFVADISAEALDGEEYERISTAFIEGLRELFPHQEVHLIDAHAVIHVKKDQTSD